MGNVLYVGKSGSEDPARAAMPFVAMSDALDQGQHPAIILMDDAVHLVRDDVADVLDSLDMPPLRQLMDKAIEHGVSIYLCAPCCTARGVTDADYVSKNGQVAGPEILAQLSVEADGVFSF